MIRAKLAKAGTPLRCDGDQKVYYVSYQIDHNGKYPFLKLLLDGEGKFLTVKPEGWEFKGVLRPGYWLGEIDGKRAQWVLPSEYTTFKDDVKSVVLEHNLVGVYTEGGRMYPIPEIGSASAANLKVDGVYLFELGRKSVATHYAVFQNPSVDILDHVIIY